MVAELVAIATNPLLLLIVAIALVFDFYNGMNDAANSVATVVSTRVLSPRMAVLWAAFFNVAAVFFYGTAVASAIGKGIVSQEALGGGIEWVTLAALLGAIFWVAIATHRGIPVSVSHCLIGGLMGAAVAKAGMGAVLWGGGKVQSTLLFIVLSPFIGLFIAVAMVLLVTAVCRNLPRQGVNRAFGRLQLVSAAFYSLGHGGNDAQKTAGIIAFLLIGTGALSPKSEIPFTILLMSHLVIGLGTYLGGWKVVRTMGMRVTKLRPYQGFCAETGGALTLAGTAIGGIPVSTTHTITGAIIGAGLGSARRLTAVRWGVTRNIIWAWVLTIPISALVAALAYLGLRAAGLTA
ncbi:MAG: inorganic phosphate transporter [Euryarchaeota archaeon]|nr:inorganic phosphate transporter [Euryarchaeota archaeon]